MANRHPHGTSSWNAYEQSSAPMTGAAAGQHCGHRSNGNDARSRSGISRGGQEPARNSRFDNSNAISSSANREQPQVVHQHARKARNEFQVLIDSLPWFRLSSPSRAL